MQTRAEQVSDGNEAATKELMWRRLLLWSFWKLEICCGCRCLTSVAHNTRSAVQDIREIAEEFNAYCIFRESIKNLPCEANWPV